MLELRQYQRDAIDALYRFWQEHPDGNPIIEVPTGGGKSLIMAQLMQEILDAKKSKILSVTHVKELVEQNRSELDEIWPFAPAGVYSAGLRSRVSWTDIVFCSIQTVYKRAQEFGRVDLLIVDEAHLIPRSADTMYGQFIRELRDINPRMLILGLTATPFRMDSGRLDDGDEKLFDKVVYRCKVKTLIDGKYLAPLVSKAMANKINVAGVHKRGGEFIIGELQTAAMKDNHTKRVMPEILSYGHDRQGWLVFCTGIRHAEEVQAELQANGIDAGIVTGHMPRGQRDEVITLFKRKFIRALVSVGVLTTGFNARHVDMIVMLRPTLSTGLYVQMAGRGMRTCGGKENCLVLDFAGNVSQHGPVDDPFIREPGKGGEAPVKVCPECDSIIHAAYRTCPDCGYEFPIEEKEKLHKTASIIPILSGTPPQWLDVDNWHLYHWHKIGGLTSMRVDYQCGPTVHSEWICFNHENFVRQKAERWWQNRAGTPPPGNVDEALNRKSELNMPVQILVQSEGKFFKITARR